MSKPTPKNLNVYQWLVGLGWIYIADSEPFYEWSEDTFNQLTEEAAQSLFDNMCLEVGKAKHNDPTH